MNNKDQDIAYFISFCIEQYKKAKGLSGGEVQKLYLEALNNQKQPEITKYKPLIINIF